MIDGEARAAAFSGMLGPRVQRPLANGLTNRDGRASARRVLVTGSRPATCPRRLVYRFNHEGGFEAYALAFEPYSYEAGHGSLRLEDQIHKVKAELSFAAQHVGTTKPLR